MEIQERLDRHLDKVPDIAHAAFVAPKATVLGDVTLGAQSSVWYGAVLRGDINSIEIGEGTNIQDLAMVHVADEYGTKIGRYCTIGHTAIIHACAIGDECLIGMGAIVLDGAEVGEQCLIGARALVTQGMKIPAGSLVLGSPAKIVKALSAQERAGLKDWATKYVANAAYCLRNAINVAEPLLS